MMKKALGLFLSLVIVLTMIPTMVLLSFGNITDQDGSPLDALTWGFKYYSGHDTVKGCCLGGSKSISSQLPFEGDE